MVCHEFHELARIIFLAIQISVIREIRGRKKVLANDNTKRLTFDFIDVFEYR